MLVYNYYACVSYNSFNKGYFNVVLEYCNEHLNFFKLCLQAVVTTKITSLRSEQSEVFQAPKCAEVAPLLLYYAICY